MRRREICFKAAESFDCLRAEVGSVLFLGQEADRRGTSGVEVKGQDARKKAGG